MKYPKISIITPSFNQGEYIEQTILSVLDQNYPNLEYMIIDAGSTDNTIDIIKKYEDKLAYWVSEPDNGQTDAINKGFAKCTGDIFNWINSDDYYEPGTFDKLAAMFAQNPSINVVCGKEWAFNNSQPKERVFHTGSIVAKNLFETIRIGIIDQPCTFWRKDKIDEFFPLDISVRFVMDRQLWLSYLMKYGQQYILQVNDIFTHFRLHPMSKSINEGILFENDFDRMKHSLFRQLNAPGILVDQLTKGPEPVNIHWPVNTIQVNNMLAEFATFYATRSYVKDDWATTSELMQWVKRWKGWKMNSKEYKLWFEVCVMPAFILRSLKVFKKKFAFCV